MKEDVWFPVRFTATFFADAVLEVWTRRLKSEVEARQQGKTPEPTTDRNKIQMAASILESISAQCSHDVSSGVWRNTILPSNPREAKLATRYWMLYAAHVLEVERAEIFHPIIRGALRGIARGLEPRPLSPVLSASKDTESPFLVGWMLGRLGPIHPSDENEGLRSPAAVLEKLRRAAQKGGRVRASMRQAAAPDWAKFGAEADAENARRKERGERPLSRPQIAKRLKTRHGLPHRLSSIIQLLSRHRRKN